MQKVPFIVVDPRATADATRGTVEQRFVEAVDVVPTVLDTLGLPIPTHRIEGRSLLPLLHGETPADWRDMTYSELDYSWRQARLTLGKIGAALPRLQPAQRRVGAMCTGWTNPSSCSTCRPTPKSSTTSAATPAAPPCARSCATSCCDFLAERKHRTTVTDSQVEAGTAGHKRAGVFFGQW